LIGGGRGHLTGRGKTFDFTALDQLAAILTTLRLTLLLLSVVRWAGGRLAGARREAQSRLLRTYG
jgi:hypothetical protein